MNNKLEAIKKIPRTRINYPLNEMLKGYKKSRDIE